MFARGFLTVSLLLAAAACGGDDDGGAPDAGLSASCQEATTRSDFEFVQESILSASCSLSTSCHAGPAPAGGLSLVDGDSEAALIAVGSTLEPDFNLVEPGDPDASYLLMILGREPLPAGVVITNPMPQANPPLCDEKIEAVARWVEQL
jgi:hypothetical protein